MSRPFPRLAAHLLSMILVSSPADPAASLPVTRTQAVSTVIDSILTPHSHPSLVRAYCLQDAICEESVFVEAGTGDTLVAPADSSWFLWIDESAFARFEHETRFVLVNGTTGAITDDVPARWWPVHNGVELYDDEIERRSSPDLVWNLGAPVDGGPTVRPFPWAAELRRRRGFPARASGGWGIIISPYSPTTHPSIGADVTRMINVFDELGVSHGPPVVEETPSTTLSAILDLPHDCDKLWVYWTGHGGVDELGFPGDVGGMSAEIFACALELLDAKDYCVIIDACHSTSVLDNLAAKGIAGFHVASAQNDQVSYMWDDVESPFLGGWYTTKFAECIEGGARGLQAYAWADSAVRALIDSLRIDGDWDDEIDTGGTPVGGYVGKFTGPGGTGVSGGGGGMTFEVAAGCSTVCVDTYVPGGAVSPDASFTVFCQLGGAWVKAGTYTWTDGQNTYFRAFENPAANGIYNISMHANHLGANVLVTWTGDTSVPVTPTSAGDLNSASIGWVDESLQELNPALGEGTNGEHDLMWEEGTFLDEVPAKTGPNWFLGLGFDIPLQPDPTHPELYENLDPAQGYADDTTFLLAYRHVVDPFTGVPGGDSAFEVTAFQPSLGMIGPFPGFFSDPGPAPRATGGPNVALPINLGRIYPEPLHLEITTFGPNAIEWEGFFLLRGAGVGVGAPEPVAASPQPIRLYPVSPNPFRPSTTLRFELERSGPVRLSVHDVSGRLVRTLLDAPLDAGPHEIRWDAQGVRGAVAAGVYFVRLEAGGVVESRRAIRLH